MTEPLLRNPAIVGALIAAAAAVLGALINAASRVIEVVASTWLQYMLKKRDGRPSDAAGSEELRQCQKYGLRRGEWHAVTKSEMVPQMLPLFWYVGRLRRTQGDGRRDFVIELWEKLVACETKRIAEDLLSDLYVFGLLDAPPLARGDALDFEKEVHEATTLLSSFFAFATPHRVWEIARPHYRLTVAEFVEMSEIHRETESALRDSFRRQLLFYRYLVLRVKQLRRMSEVGKNPLG